jgi:RHS repeat-associated protein
MDRPAQITDKLGNISTISYNNMNRPASFTDPNNNVISLTYNSRGWLDTITRGGKDYQTGYDDEGIASSSTNPAGNSVAYQTDKLGYATSMTNPLNQSITLSMDSMNRVTGITDPLSRTTNYGYDSRGYLSSVTMPVIGTANYQRNDIGLLTQITDLNSQNWGFNYTTTGRLLSSTDPLNNTWQYGYDTRGRLSTKTFPDGSTATMTYDNAGNVSGILYSGGLNIQFTYDSLNRLLTANNISLTRDAEEKIIATDNSGTIFGATYDNGGRLNTVTYNNNAFTVTYSYDSTTGLLSSVTDNLTGTQINLTYDNANRLSGISRSNGINTTFTYDNASRLTRIQDRPSTGSGLIDLQYTLNAAGEVASVNITAPLDHSTLLTTSTDNFTYDASSQINTSGYVYDSMGRLTASPGHTYTWDGASRLTGIDGITLAYNGMDDLIIRTDAGQTTRYYYNKAIGLSPIAAEKDDSVGQMLRYYVWTPGGQLLYMIDAANSNNVYHYHFDRTGSTLALTDSTGTVTDSYAYTPYGKLLQHNGTNQQPFTFVGQWGVRQDPSTGSGATGSGLYHMRARYYDANTARFISREPVWPMLTDPKEINPYQYAMNEPVRNVDVTGLRSSVEDELNANLNKSYEEYSLYKQGVKSAEKRNKERTEDISYLREEYEKLHETYQYFGRARRESEEDLSDIELIKDVGNAITGGPKKLAGKALAKWAGQEIIEDIADIGPGTLFAIGVKSEVEDSIKSFAELQQAYKEAMEERGAEIRRLEREMAEDTRLIQYLKEQKQEEWDKITRLEQALDMLWMMQDMADLIGQRELANKILDSIIKK